MIKSGLNSLPRPKYASAAGGGSPNAILLMHFDGTNGSTTFTDVYGTAMTGQTGGSLTTAQQKFGTASATGTNGSGSICNANSTSLTLWDFLTGDFTIECWINQGASNRNGIFSTTSTKGPAIGIFGTTIFFGPGAGPNFSATFSFSASTWYAIAWVRHSGASQLYVNGNATGTSHADTFSYHPSADAPFTTQIGYDSQLSGVGTLGFLDELRISNIARYTANYTPATSAFTN